MNALKGGYTLLPVVTRSLIRTRCLPDAICMLSMPRSNSDRVCVGKRIALAKQTIETYKQRHNDSIPRKVSYTSGHPRFIETGGATIAQVLYMLGVEPVRDAFGRVSDLKLIPSAELGRPRIDVVVQTSGQLRDLAASRLFLVNRAVEMAAGQRRPI